MIDDWKAYEVREGMEHAIPQSQVVEMIHSQMEKIPTYKIYYTMKMMRVKPLVQTRVDKMRACFAISKVGLPITTHLLGWVLGIGERRRRYGLVRVLHTLGDKQCLTLKRGSRVGMGYPHEWIVSALFRKYYDGDWEE